MGKPTGFMEIKRVNEPAAPVEARVEHYREFVFPLADAELRQQGARCMDCGIPFCHSGCPVNNIIPDWNDLVYRNRWREALEVLHSTNNFPEFTGRICPAPCEAACTLNINDDAVAIKSIEHAIIDHAWEKGWIEPKIPVKKTGRKVAVVGSGPAGLACSQQLARAGHEVVLFEKNDRIGGLLRYGIPDFKMEKHHIDRRMEQMQAEGVEFRVNQHVGIDIPAKKLLEEFDAVVLSGGSETPRDLPVPGRELAGVHFALDFLIPQNKVNAGDRLPDRISAQGKHVIVIGGGDTGSDCVGTSIRQGARSVTQLEVMPKPPLQENRPLTWPNWPMKLRTSSSQEEGCLREWSVVTKEFSGNSGKVETLHCVRVEWTPDEKGGMKMQEIPGSEFDLEADLVLLAMGYLHPVHANLLTELGVELDPRGNVKADTTKYQTSVPKVFSAGDMRRGQSLVVWAIREGRQAARSVDEFLVGYSELPR
ncbi:MAG: glutamate synthase subunit beta [Burkholderiales bacterium]|nr:glutamate synthase subunit beta [Burkholderiales bacterium]